MDEWRKTIEQFVEHNEGRITALLLVIAAILIMVALFGSVRHKALAMVYIIL